MRTNKLTKKLLFLDTETTGFKPGNICQLSYLIIDGNNIIPNNYFFKVNYVEAGAQSVHGLSVGKLEKLSDNMSFKDKVTLVKKDFDNTNLLVGHNISFDLKFIISEFENAGQYFNYDHVLCTMKYFTNIVKISKGRGSGYKWPKLYELTNFFKISDKEIMKATEELFESKNLDYHDARFDTVATYLAYIKGLEHGLIEDNFK